MTPKHMSIPNFYIEIHNLFMKFFKNGPECISDILNESLWLNDNIMVNKNYLYLKSWENNSISQVRDIFKRKWSISYHEELKQKYNITTTFLQAIQVQQSIPTSWIQKTKHCRITTNIHSITNGIYIKINNSLSPVSETLYKSYYCHIINQDKQTKYN